MIIYKLTNGINGKIYIGLTTATLEKRLRQHHYGSRHGADRPLYRAMRKYGEDIFSAEAIDTAETLEELKQKEQYWIKYYDSYSKGYNATRGGDTSTKNTIHYLKISLETGEILKEYNSATECNLENGGSATQNADLLTETQYNNYIIIKKENVKNYSKEQIIKYAFSLRPKIICQLDKNNKLIKRWINSGDILKAHPDYSKSCIFQCLWGKRKTHKKYQWKYYKDWDDNY